MADGASDPSTRLTEVARSRVATIPLTELEAEPEFAEPEPEPESEPEPEPGLLNDRERRRMDRVMAGLSEFRPVAELQRPAPRHEVDSLSSVSAADWSGMDGMGESIAPLPRSEPSQSPPRVRQEPIAMARPVVDQAPTPLPQTDPIKGWVTADRLFSDFGD